MDRIVVSGCYPRRVRPESCPHLMYGIGQKLCMDLGYAKNCWPIKAGLTCSYRIPKFVIIWEWDVPGCGWMGIYHQDATPGFFQTWFILSANVWNGSEVMYGLGMFNTLLTPQSEADIQLSGSRMWMDAILASRCYSMLIRPDSYPHQVCDNG